MDLPSRGQGVPLRIRSFRKEMGVTFLSLFTQEVTGLHQEMR